MNPENSATVREVSIQIPEGAEPGDTINFEVDGKDVELEVPFGCVPGDVLEIQLAGDDDEEGGEEAQNGRAGDSKLSSSHLKDQNVGVKDDKNENIVRISLGGGNDKIIAATNSNTMVLRCVLPPLSAKLLSSPSTPEKENDNSSNDGTYAMAWPAGRFLVDYLSTMTAKKQLVKAGHPYRSVLELGSGLGLVGIAFAHQILREQQEHQQHLDSIDDSGKKLDESEKKSNSGEQIAASTAPLSLVLSDMPCAIPLLDYNLQMNRHLLPPCVNVTTKAIFWSEEDCDESNYDNDFHRIALQQEIGNSHTKCDVSHSSNIAGVSTTSLERAKKGEQEKIQMHQQGFDLIIGSDILYNAKNIPALISTIRKNIAGPSSSSGPCTSRILLSTRWRKPDLERNFFTELQKLYSGKLKWKLLESKCPLSYKDYGNDKCVESNRYFHSTLVGVQGKPMPLSEIKEAHTEQMTRDEFEAWEKFQIQIYLGYFVSEKEGQ